MDYISSKEIAIKWGISPRRVTILAKEGRINGAFLLGHNWMIPKDAQKPLDPRKEANKGHTCQCPIFIYNYDGTNKLRDGLNKEEKLLYDAQEHFIHNELKEASQILNKLCATSKDSYVLIGSYLMLGHTSIELHNLPVFEKCIKNLDILFENDFECKNELSYFLTDLKAHTAVRQLWTSNLDISPLSSSSKEFYSFFAVNTVYLKLMRQVSELEKADTTLLELLCAEFDTHNYLFSSQLVHVFMSCIYFLNGQTDLFLMHIKKALNIAEKIDSYLPLAVGYRFVGSFYNRLLPSYPKEVGKKLNERCKNYTESLEILNKHFVKETFPLSAHDYELIAYALSGMKNRDIAKMKGISEATVNKYFSDIYSKCNVKNKKALVETIRSIPQK